MPRQVWRHLAVQEVGVPLLALVMAVAMFLLAPPQGMAQKASGEGSDTIPVKLTVHWKETWQDYKTPTAEASVSESLDFTADMKLADKFSRGKPGAIQLGYLAGQLTSSPGSKDVRDKLVSYSGGVHYTHRQIERFNLPPECTSTITEEGGSNLGLGSSSMFMVTIANDALVMLDVMPNFPFPTTTKEEISPSAPPEATMAWCGENKIPKSRQHSLGAIYAAGTPGCSGSAMWTGHGWTGTYSCNRTQQGKPGSQSFSFTLELNSEDEDARVALAGCTNLAVGQSVVLTAIGQPDGGSFRYWAEPSGPLGIQQAGESATLRGQSPGRTTVFVEYTAPGGKTAKQSQPGSCVKLISVNGGAELPKLGIYDAKGQHRSPVRTVPFQAEPSGDLLNFTPEQPIASVVPKGDSLQLQGTREGKTVVQARTQCGQAMGSPLALEVVPCDDEVIAELKQQIDAVRTQMDQNRKQVNQALTDPEFDRAAREVAGDTRKLAWDTSRSIASVIGVGAKISEAAGSTAVTMTDNASAGSDAMSVANQLLDTMNGDIGSAAVSAGLKSVSNYTEGLVASLASAASALKTLKSAIDSAAKFGQDLGTLDGVADRIAELERLHDQEMFDFNVLDKRLRGVCKYKGSGTKAPGTGGTNPNPNNPSNGPASGPPSQPSGPDTPPTTDSNPPVGPDNPPIDQPPPGEPPTTDDSTASLALSSHRCGQGPGISSQPNQLAAGLKNLAASTKTFGSGPLASFQNSLQQWQQVLMEVKSAVQLPDAQRREQMRKLLPRVQSILPEAQAFGQAGQSFLDTIGGCPSKLPPALQSMAQKAKQPVP